MSLVLLMLAVAVLGPLAPRQAGAASNRQWRVVTASGGQLYANQAFSLYNTREDDYVRYGSRTWGINLVWTSRAPRNFVVVRQSGTGPIKYGELVALKETNPDGGYIRYASRPYGVNLDWSGTPVYEWKLLGGSTGTAVNNRAVVTLHNTQAPKPEIAPWCGTKGAALVNGWRPVGINLVWDPPGFYYRDIFATALIRAAAAALGMSIDEYKQIEDTYCALRGATTAAGGERAQDDDVDRAVDGTGEESKHRTADGDGSENGARPVRDAKGDVGGRCEDRAGYERGKDRVRQAGAATDDSDGKGRARGCRDHDRERA
jgi:hypothetical protein